MIRYDLIASRDTARADRAALASHFAVLISLRGIQHPFRSHTIAFCFLDESRVVRLRAISAITIQRVRVNQNKSSICIKATKSPSKASGFTYKIWRRSV